MLCGGDSAAVVLAALTIALLLSACSCSAENNHGQAVETRTSAGHTSSLVSSIPAPITPSHGDSSHGDGDGGSGASSIPGTAGDMVTTSNSLNHSTVGSRPTMRQTSSTATIPPVSSITRVYVTSGLQVSPPVAASESLGTGIIVGIVVGVSAAVVVVSIVLYALMKRQKTGRYVGYRMSNLARRNADETEDPVTYRNDAFGAWKAYDDL